MIEAVLPAGEAPTGYDQTRGRPRGAGSLAFLHHHIAAQPSADLDSPESPPRPPKEAPCQTLRMLPVPLVSPTRVAIWS